MGSRNTARRASRLGIDRRHLEGLPVEAPGARGAGGEIALVAGLDAGDGEAHRAGGQILQLKAARHAVLDALDAEKARADEQPALGAGDGGDAFGQGPGGVGDAQRGSRRRRDGAVLGVEHRRCRLGLGRVLGIVERRGGGIGFERDRARGNDPARDGRERDRRRLGRLFTDGRRRRGQFVDAIAGAHQRRLTGARGPLDHRRRRQRVRIKTLPVVKRGARSARPFTDDEQRFADGDQAAHDVDLAALIGAEFFDLVAAAGDAQNAGAAGADPDHAAQTGGEGGDAGVRKIALPLAAAQFGETLGAAGPDDFTVGAGQKAGEKAAHRRGREVGPGAVQAARQTLGGGDPDGAVTVDGDAGHAIGGQPVFLRHHAPMSRLPSNETARRAGVQCRRRVGDGGDRVGVGVAAHARGGEGRRARRLRERGRCRVAV